ncbi:SPOR domain-containing protein [Chitinilyticum piscinae]|uniref:SPOR domain-containing protein n=1 Tax=Chitinilyticum piscinae TaxID=2866724 RepID=A0A8J7G0B2_9NEIS|nr:SPOR domain-containing protein [Chitinilyticum piscinae]MBE9609620.1 SPOR domain-containing protein [Chitinilyticum piscinae]
MPQQNIPEELHHLRKRARRRLIGAIALVVFSLCVLWTALDSQPPASMQQVQPIEVISSAPALVTAAPQPAASAIAVADQASLPDAAAVASSVAQPPAEPPAEESPTAALPGKLVNVQQPEASTTAKPKPAPTARPTPKPTEKPAPKPTAAPKPTTDPQRILDGLDDPSAVKHDKAEGKTYWIQVGAYADADKAAAHVSKIKGAGLPVVTDKIDTKEKGVLTRVRLGPTKDEAKAKEALRRLEALGVDGRLIAK